jgi:hypothetical protein
VLGDLQSEARLCLSMRGAGVVVVDVNYRHCPGMLLMILLYRSVFVEDYAILRCSFLQM